MDSVRKLWSSRPVLVIMLLAAALRLPAVLFAKGYGMHDDHFCVIEDAQRWVEGHDLPSPERVPKRNFLYVGFHYGLFKSLEALRLGDPELKMYVVRLLHAAYSLLTVWFGTKLARDLAGDAVARRAGLLLAGFWVMPYMSVRNLTEFVCIPPLVVAVYLAARHRGSADLRNGLLAGFTAGAAFTLRYQTIVFLAILGLVLLLRGEWKRVTASAAGFVVLCALTLGIPEWLVISEPFATFRRYFAHNVVHARSYVTSPWFTYAGTLLAAFIPPFSFALVWGFFRSWRQATVVFWPTVAFFVVHSAFPTKQERFILPIVAFVLIGGVIGLDRIAQRLSRGSFWRKLMRVLWGWFLVVNAVLLVVSVSTFSKKTRVASMSYLHGKKNVTALVVENNRSSSPRMPLFYLGGWPKVYDFPASKSVEALRQELDESGAPRPDYVIFLGSKNLERRVERVGHVFPALELEAQIIPSLVDRLLYSLNPEHNVNQTSYVYRILGDA
jgi:hypothetical protein